MGRCNGNLIEVKKIKTLTLDQLQKIGSEI